MEKNKQGFNKARPFLPTPEGGGFQAASFGEEEVTVAAASLRKAEVVLQDAQWAYDRVAFKGDVGASSEAATLQESTIDYQTALANYQMSVEDASQEEILSSVSQVASARSSLNNLLEGSSEEELVIAQASVETARMALEQSQREVEQATLVARFSGTVTAVNVGVGERLEVAGVIDLADLSELVIDVPVDEIDLPQVKVGQKAIVVLDALPDTNVFGAVSAIAPSPDTSSSIVSYQVTVTLDEQQPGAVVGMTGNVSIETERRENVLVIPASIVAVDDTTGATYVNKVVDGFTARAEVALGLRDGDMIEVMSGLQEGDLLTAAAIAPKTSSGTTEERGGMGFPMMGGGPPPEGGGARPPGAGGSQ